MYYVFGPVSHASCHMYVIKSVSKKALHVDYLTFMWRCKYSYVESSFPLTKIYCMETEYLFWLLMNSRASASVKVSDN